MYAASFFKRVVNFPRSLYLVVGGVMSLSALAILWWWGGSRSHPDTHGWRLSLALPPFPSQLSFDELNSAVLSTDFLIFLHASRNCLAIEGLLIHREIKRQNRETVSWHPKP